MIFYFLNLIVFIIPAYFLRFYVFGLPLNLLEVLVYCLFVFWIVAGGKISKNYGIFLPIFLIFAGATLSAVFSDNLIISAGIWKSYFLSPLLFFTVFFNSLSGIGVNERAEKLENLLKWFLFSGYIVAIISYVYLLFGILTYDGRLRAFYLSPNHLAMFLAPVFLVNLYFLFGASGIKKTILFFGIIFIALLFYATRSSGAWIGLAAGIFYWLISKQPIKYRWLFGKKTVVYCGIFLVFLSVIMALNISAIADYFDASGRSSLHSRLMIWRSAAEILKDNLVFGIGPGMFQEYYLAYQQYFTPYLEWSVPQPHNVFLAFWLQAGILGIIGFIYIMIMLCFRLSLKKRTEFHLLVIAFLIYFLVHGIVDTVYWKNDLSLIFWFFIGIALIAPLNDKMSD